MKQHTTTMYVSTLIYEYIRGVREYCTVAIFIDNLQVGSIVKFRPYSAPSQRGQGAYVKAMVTAIDWEYNGRKLKVPYVRLRRNHVPPTDRINFRLTQ